MNQFKDAQIDILSIYLSPKLSSGILSKTMKVRFFSLYFSDEINRYSNYIIKGGITDEGELPIANICVLTRENFIDFFSNLIKNYQ